jgi:ribonuclease HI
MELAVQRSKYLQRLGFQLEIRWILGHAGVRANQCAKTNAARAMARSRANCIEDETIQLIIPDGCCNAADS